MPHAPLRPEPQPASRTASDASPPMPAKAWTAGATSAQASSARAPTTAAKSHQGRSRDCRRQETPFSPEDRRSPHHASVRELALHLRCSRRVGLGLSDAVVLGRVTFELRPRPLSRALRPSARGHRPAAILPISVRGGDASDHSALVSHCSRLLNVSSTSGKVAARQNRRRTIYEMFAAV